MNKRTLENFQPEQKLNSEQKADSQHVSPADGNTNVIGGQVPTMFLGDAVVALVAKENLIDLKTFLDFIMSCLKNVDGFYEWFDEKYKSKDFSIAAKVGDSFYVDLSQIRELYSSMSSNAKLVRHPS